MLLTSLQPVLPSSTPAEAKSDDSFVVNIEDVEAAITVAKALYRATRTPPPYTLPLYYTNPQNQLYNHAPAASHSSPSQYPRKPFAAATVKQLDNESLPKRTLSPKQNFIGDSNLTQAPRNENSENRKAFIKDNIRLRKDVAELRGVVASVHDRISSLEEENRQLQVVLNESIGHVTNKQNRILQLENDLKSNDAELKQQRALADSVSTERDNKTTQLREEVIHLRDNIAVKEHTVQSLEAERDRLRTDVTKLNQKLDKQNELRHSLLKELELLSALYEKAHANHTNQRELFESRASQLEEKNEQLFQTVAAFEKANTGLQQDNAYLLYDNEQLRRALGRGAYGQRGTALASSSVDSADTADLDELAECRRQITQLRNTIKVDREHWANERRIWERYATGVNQLWRDEWSKRELRIQEEMDRWRWKMEDDVRP